MSFSTSDIRYSKLQYFKCPHGDLHEGEHMTMVCVDSTCTNKGLICPICRMQDHDKHKTIPLKSFLSYIHDKFLSTNGQQSESSLNNLADYLQRLDTIRMDLLSVLKDAVNSIAEKVRKVEQEIVQNYANLRKLVLTQTTIATKLPDLIKMMTDTSGSRNSKEIQEDFKKYASLLMYEKCKELSFMDSSKKIVEEYSQLPNTITLHLTTLLPNITKIFDSLPLSLERPKSVSTKEDYTFDSLCKFIDMSLEENNKKVVMLQQMSSQGREGGYVLVGQGSGKQGQKISFRILQSNSDSIRLGMILPDICIKNANYFVEQSDINHGLFCISALALTYQHNNPDKQDSQESFIFGPGDIIDIQWVPQTKTITFSRRHGVEKSNIIVNLKDEQLEGLKFAVGMFGILDQVEIVDTQ